ncbi:unnamed protein product, partial [Prorocentrum cordatum]
VPRIVLLNPQIPVDAQIWIKVQCNSMVAVGSSTSFVERLEITPVIAAHWVKFLKDERDAAKKRAADDAQLDDADAGSSGNKGDDGNGSRFKGFEAKYNRFVKENYREMFDGLEDFKRAALFKKRCDALQIWDRLVDWWGEFVVFEERRMNPKAMFLVFDKIGDVLAKDSYHGAFGDAMFEVLKYAVPTVFEPQPKDDDDDGEADVAQEIATDVDYVNHPDRDVRWILQKTSDCKRLVQLTTPMADSSIFKDALSASPAKRLLTTVANPKAKGKAKPKGSAKAAVTPDAVAHCTQAGSTVRSTMFLDDVMNAVVHPVRKIDRSHWNTGELRRMVRFGVLLGMKLQSDKGKVVFQFGDRDSEEEHFALWKMLRPRIMDHCYDVHSELVEKPKPEGDDKNDCAKDGVASTHQDDVDMASCLASLNMAIGSDGKNRTRTKKLVADFLTDNPPLQNLTYLEQTHVVVTRISSTLLRSKGRVYPGDDLQDKNAWADEKRKVDKESTMLTIRLQSVGASLAQWVAELWADQSDVAATHRTRFLYIQKALKLIAENAQFGSEPIKQYIINGIEFGAAVEADIFGYDSVENGNPSSEALWLRVFEIAEILKGRVVKKPVVAMLRSREAQVKSKIECVKKADIVKALQVEFPGAVPEGVDTLVKSMVMQLLLQERLRRMDAQELAALQTWKSLLCLGFEEGADALRRKASAVALPLTAPDAESSPRGDNADNAGAETAETTSAQPQNTVVVALEQCTQVEINGKEYFILFKGMGACDMSRRLWKCDEASRYLTHAIMEEWLFGCGPAIAKPVGGSNGGDDAAAVPPTPKKPKTRVAGKTEPAVIAARDEDAAVETAAEKVEVVVEDENDENDEKEQHPKPISLLDVGLDFLVGRVVIYPGAFVGDGARVAAGRVHIEQQELNIFIVPNVNFKGPRSTISAPAWSVPVVADKAHEEGAMTMKVGAYTQVIKDVPGVDGGAVMLDRSFLMIRPGAELLAIQQRKSEEGAPAAAAGTDGEFAPLELEPLTRPKFPWEFKAAVQEDEKARKALGK